MASSSCLTVPECQSGWHRFYFPGNCSPGFETKPTLAPLFAWFVAGVGANLFARFPPRSAPFANKFAPTPGNPAPGEQLRLYIHAGFAVAHEGRLHDHGV